MSKTDIDDNEYKKANEAKFVVTPLQAILLQAILGLKLLFMFLKEAVLGIVTLIKGRKVDDIKGQLCLITGGANGLGRETALRLAKEGCRIAIADIVSTDNTVKEIVEIYGVKCQGFKCDVSDNNSIEKLRTDIEASMGPIDILVNNAGLLFMGPLLKASIESIEKCVSVNLVSHFKTVKTFLPGMIERKRGRIVAIASISAKLTLPLGITYSSTKYGVHGLMEALYDELCLDDFDEFIKLTTVFPYFINTRKSLGDLLDELEDPVPRLTAEFTANEIVKGMMENRRNVLITPMSIHKILHLFPDAIRKYLKTTSMNTKQARAKFF